MTPKIFQSKVLNVEYVTPSVKHLNFSVPKDFEFEPGQYLSLSVYHEGKRYRSPFSIANFSSKEKSVDFFIRLNKNGRTSSFINGLKSGDDLELFGPLGKFTINSNSENKDLIFISSGTGITAFMSMISNLLKKRFKKRLILLKGFRNEDEILYEKESKELAEKYKNFEFHNILSQPKNKDFSHIGHVQNFIENYVDKNFDGDFYICGLKEMVEDVKKKILDMGFSEENIFFEKYD